MSLLTKFAKTMGQPQMGGMFPMGNHNSFSAMMPFSPGMNLGAAAQAGQNNPNPLKQIKTPQMGSATAAGVQQMAQKTAHQEWFETLFPVPYTLHKLAEVATAGSSAPAAGTSSLGGGSSGASTGAGKGGLGTPAAPMGSQQGNQAGQAGGGGGMGGSAQGAMNGALGGQMGGQVGAFGVVRPGWNTLRPNNQPIGGVTPKTAAYIKAAMMTGAPQPVPGQTANAPVPQPGMPPTAAPQMPPPNGGAPVAQGMGQPSVDPATGQPMQPPAPGGDPAAQGGMPPGAPPGPVDPVTGQPVTSPMQDPMPPSLPANPRMLPPRPATPHDNMQNSVLGGLGQDMDMADEPMNAGEAQEDMNSEAMAMGSKTASWSDYLVFANPKSTIGIADPYSDPRGYSLRLMRELAEKSAATPALPEINLSAGLGPVSPSGALGKDLNRPGGTFKMPEPKPLPANFKPTVPAPAGSPLATLYGVPSPIATPPAGAEGLGARMLAAQAKKRAVPPPVPGTAARPFSLDGADVAPKPRAVPQRGKLPLPKGKLGLLLGAGGLGLAGLLGKSSGDYTFSGEDCPKCGVSMEGDSYTGTCNSCRHKWGEKKALSLTADEGGEDAPALPGSPMRGWQWKVLQKQQDEAEKAWMPRLFKTESTPLTELLASPAKQGLLGGLAGGAAGAGLGMATNKVVDTGNADWKNALIGGGLGTILGGFQAYGHRRKANDKVTDALRRTPPGATVADYQAVQESDAAMKAKKTTKAAAQAQDGSMQPARSGSGESAGLSYAMKDDHHAKGKDAWDSVSHYFKGHSKRKVQPDIQKGQHSALTKEAKAFLGKLIGRGAKPIVDSTGKARPPIPGFAPLPPGAPRPPMPKPQAAGAAPASPTAATKTYVPGQPPAASTGKPATTVSRAEAQAADAGRTATLGAVGTKLPAARTAAQPGQGAMGEIGRSFPELAKWLKGGPRTWMAMLGMGGGTAAAMSPKMAIDFHARPDLPGPPTKPEESTPDTSSPWAVPAAVGGAGILGLAALAMRRRKDEEEEEKDAYDQCTDFAKGFFRRCDEMGVPLREGVEKVGSDYGEEARAELLDGLEKVAKSKYLMEGGKGIVNFGKGLFGGAKAPALPKVNPGSTFSEATAATRAYSAQRAANAATRASGAYQAGQAVRPLAGQVGRQVAPTAAGALAGGMSGNDLGVFGDDKSGPLGMNQNAMLAGAAAFNPFARRLAGRTMGGYGAAPLQGLRTGFLGSFAGSGVDSTAGALGYDTKGQFGQLGGKLGFGAGMLRSGAGTTVSRMGANAPSWLRTANKGMVRGEKGVRDFAYSGFDPLVGTAKALVRKPIQWASGGAFKGPAWAQASTKVPSAGRVAGRLVGGLGLGATGLGYGSQYINNKIDSKVDETVGRVYNEAMPQIGQDVAGMLDEYMGERGMLDQQGQFDPSSRMMKGLSGGADSIFRSMGMDPTKMSPLQKVMILGGATAGTGGMLAGSPVLAGMGGASAMAGLMPSFMPGQGQQRMNSMFGPQAQGYGQPQQGGQPQNGFAARNEWMAQGGGQE